MCTKEGLLPRPFVGIGLQKAANYFRQISTLRYIFISCGLLTKRFENIPLERKKTKKEQTNQKKPKKHCKRATKKPEEA